MKEPWELAVLRPRRSRLFRWRPGADLGLRPPGTDFPEPPRTSARDLGPLRLAIDFGTSAIAMILVSGKQRRRLSFKLGDQLKAKHFLESPIAMRRSLDKSRLEDNYEIELSFTKAGSTEWAYFPCLKRRIELLARRLGRGEWEERAALDVAAVCLKAIAMARDDGGRTLRELVGPRPPLSPVCISVPNSFPEAGVEVLRRGVAYGVAAALDMLDLPTVETLLEGEAVAYGHFIAAGPGGAAGSPTSTILVIDAGAGTTDASLARREGESIQLVAHAGLPVGGLDLDALIARLIQPFEEATPLQLSGNLRRAAEQKVHLWGTSAASGNFDQQTEALASAITSGGGRAGELERITAQLRGGYERFLALAVRTLIETLPAGEGKIDRVVLSGRGSLLQGFEQEVNTVLAERGVEARAEGLGSEDLRKLEVVEGVAHYVLAPRPAQERRPRRAGHELILRHLAVGEASILVEAGSRLLDGWSVVTWRQPGADRPGAALAFVEMRMIPGSSLERLAVLGCFGEAQRERLETWCSREVCSFESKTPYTAWCAYDFLSQSFSGKVDGGPALVAPRSYGGTDRLGLLHPVHLKQEDWFEQFLGERT